MRLPSFRAFSTSISRAAMSPARLLVTAAEAEDLLNKDQHAIALDATWFMPNVKRDPQAEFEEHHLPGAQRWDVDGVAAPHELKLPHMMPDATMFASACGKLGIRRDSTVIVYDGHGLLSAPRTLFTFKAFDHDKVYAINGGMLRWLAEGRKVETGPAQPVEPATYEVAASASPQRDIRSYDEIVSSSQSGQDLILDARPAPRFHGTAPEPRPGLESGHMPNSLSLPFSALLTPASTEPGSYTSLLPDAELRTVLAKAMAGEAELEKVLRGERKVITTCGSGMTASVVWLALQTLGAKDIGLYDESWMGYAARKQSVIEKTSS